MISSLNSKVDNKVKDLKVDGILTIYESNLNNQGKFKVSKIETDDLKEIIKQKYDTSFWKNNDIVKRTQNENNLIKIFEQKDVFSNMKLEDF